PDLPARPRVGQLGQGPLRRLRLSGVVLHRPPRRRRPLRDRPVEAGDDRRLRAQIAPRMRAVLVAALALAVAAPAAAASGPSLAKLESEVMCPVCNTTLDQPDSPAAAPT